MNDDDLQRELERLARSDATSGRRALAKLTALPTEPRRCRFRVKAEAGMPRRLALGRGAPLAGRIDSALSADASNAARQDAKAMDGGRRHHVTAGCRESSRRR